MNRRTLLSSIGAVAIGGFAGCTSDGTADAETPGKNENAGDDQSADGDSSTGSDPSTGNETSTGNDQSTGDGDSPVAHTPTDGECSETTQSSGTPVSLAGSSLKLLDSGCGNPTDEASVQFEPDSTTVVVSGTIWGSDGCAVPTLADVRYDGQADELSVTVTTKNRQTEEPMACIQCIVELDYRATVEFDGGLPESVTVTHDHGEGGEIVATATSC